MRAKVTDATPDVVDMISTQYGCDLEELRKLGLKFVIGGKGRVFAYKECELDDENVRNVRKGLYVGAIERNGFRLSIEGSFIFGRFAKKNVVEVDEERAVRWLEGEDIEVEVDGEVEGYCIIKWGEYFLGSGLIRTEGRKTVVKNFVPKDRRLRGRGGENGKLNES